MRQLLGSVTSLFVPVVFLLILGGLFQWSFVVNLPLVGSHPYISAVLIAVLISGINRVCSSD